MPPIPIYTESPINAAKASASTPQTAPPHDGTTDSHPSVTTASPSKTEGTTAAPRPGAAPSLPAPTGTTSRYTPVQPTPTSKAVEHQGPPPPQPGAVPMPLGGLGATATPYRTAEPVPSVAQPVPYPPQMSVPPPTVPFPQRGTMAATSSSFSPPVHSHNSLGQVPISGGTLAHPPGYQQDVNASEFGSRPRAAHNAAPIISDGRHGGAEADNDEEGMWTSALKWAQAAGEKLSAAESEVWKRINKE